MMNPADIAQADQWTAKFADMTVRMMAELGHGAPDEQGAARFDAVFREADDDQLVPFVSYLVAQLISYHWKLDRLAEALAAIQTITVNVMTNKAAQAKMIAAANEFREEVEAQDSLFSADALQAEGLAAETYTTGTGQVLSKVHPLGSCVGFCVIHRPIEGPWSLWPTHWRDDRHIMERLCPHGVGHPAIEDVLRSGDGGTHGCDGCECGPRLVEEKLQKALREELNRDETDSTGI